MAYLFIVLNMYFILSLLPLNLNFFLARMNEVFVDDSDDSDGPMFSFSISFNSLMATTSQANFSGSIDFSDYRKMIRNS